MNKEKILRITGMIIGIGVHLPLLYGSLISWKKPIIFDGNYIIVGYMYLGIWLICYIIMIYLYRVGGIPYFKILYQAHKHVGTQKKFILKMVTAYIFGFILLFLWSRAMFAPLILSEKNNTPTDIIFLITNVERESYTQTLNRINGYSYLHNKEIRFPWNKKHIDRGWIDTCVMLKTDGNQWGKMIRSVEKIPRNRCPKVNDE